MNTNTVVIVRSFQSGTGGKGKDFDSKMFEERVERPVRRLLGSAPMVKALVVVTNGEKGNRLAENVDEENETPTTRAINLVFFDEVHKGLVRTHICKKWGLNPGSGRALNEGIGIAKKINGAEWILNWSPDIGLDGHHIASAFQHIEQRRLDVAGFVREMWWANSQWNVPQNTASLWKISLLSKIGGFHPRCDGNGGTISIPEYGEVPIAGMEDFHAVLRMLVDNTDFRWGMVGRSDPLIWNTDFPPGSERERNHLIKVARQYKVMQVYAKELMPKLSFNEVMSMLFKRYHLD